VEKIRCLVNYTPDLLQYLRRGFFPCLKEVVITEAFHAAGHDLPVLKVDCASCRGDCFQELIQRGLIKKLHVNSYEKRSPLLEFIATNAKDIKIYLHHVLLCDYSEEWLSQLNIVGIYLAQ
jgi:hypothetical protein